MVAPDDIESITVMHSAEASALYGSMASNGVILITTKSAIGQPFQTVPRKNRYSSITVSPRKFSTTREFYVPKPSKSAGERKDFRNTVYWNHTIVTDKDGNAKVSFYNNDMVSAFRITAEGFSNSGLIGRNETVYYTSLPLALDVKLPNILDMKMC
jgi:TonB-dependent SusC/RagA subfamily outer membrane receptor